MQSIFQVRLPWSTEAPGDKMIEKPTLHKSRPAMVDVPNFMNKMKRKRTDSPEPASAHVLKKWKSVQDDIKPTPAVNATVHVTDGVVNQSAKALSSQLQATSRVAAAGVLDSRPIAQPVKREGTSQSKVPHINRAPAPSTFTVNDTIPTANTDLSSMQQAIEAQINYEILIKHNELRLIEQELAKCQVSLEQLRRCTLIPFPGTEGLSMDVSGGAGSALEPPSGYTQPQYAAPWGVTDGPYTQHYARWLIPDPKFDPMPERAMAQQSQGYFGAGEGRTTRGSFAEFGSTGRARTSRTSTGTLKLQALGDNPAPAPKVDPLLHKRSTDGKWVRLFCAQCGHSNFSNTQGFLNHCRIKHNRTLKSHDEAAIACGVPVDVNEAGNPVSAVEPQSSTATTPVVTFPPSTTPGVVHPLVRSNPAEWAKDVHRDFDKSPSQPSPTAPTTCFVKAPSTPYLSSLLGKRGFKGDFGGLVENTQRKVDLSLVVDSFAEDGGDSAVQTPISQNTPQQSRLPSVSQAPPMSSSTPARPGTKGQTSNQARLLPPPVNVRRGSFHMPDSPIELSPNTVESNPGLVSDHDDDDDEDGYDAHSQADVNMDDDVMVEDASDVEGLQEREDSTKVLNGCFQKGEGSRKH